MPTETASPAGTILQGQAEKGDFPNMPWREDEAGCGAWRVLAGSCFPVVLEGGLHSAHAAVGDAVRARLVKDMVVGGKVVARAGSLVTGEVSYRQRARNKLKSDLSIKRWRQTDGLIGLKFNEIISTDGYKLTMSASPAAVKSSQDEGGKEPALGITSQGYLTTGGSGGLNKYDAAHFAVDGALSLTGPVGSFVVAPLVHGALSAASPSYAEGRKVKAGERSGKTKRFAMGVIDGVPGGFLVTDAFRRGQEVVVPTGQLIMLELESDVEVGREPVPASLP
jgi:hypothetical protein